MLKRGIFLFMLVLAGCSNQPASKEINVRPASPVKSKGSTIKSSVNPWTTGSFAAKEGKTEGIKFVRFVTEGDFSDSTQTKSYLFAEVIVNKSSAGIFLHEMKKSSPAEEFSKPVQIKITNSSGQELQMVSTRRWNNSGGILIEKNNNDYSQFRIFLLQSKGIVTVEIKNSGAKIYHFSINSDGFSDSFARI